MTRRDYLLHRYLEHKTQRNREDLINAYAYLAEHTANLMAKHRRLAAIIEVDDLVGAGYMGLINAVDQYDPRRGTQFASYAITLIRGAIVDHIRSTDWVPRSVRDASRAGKMGVVTCCSLDTTGLQKPGQDALSISDIIPDPSEGPEEMAIKAVCSEDLLKHIYRLPERECRVVRLYYGNDLTFKQIGEQMGFSESRAYQLHRQAIKRLRKWVPESVPPA